MVQPASSFHDATGAQKSTRTNALNALTGPLYESLRGAIFIMLPAHFHDVTYDHIWKKNSAGAHKEPSKKYKNSLRTLKSKPDLKVKSCYNPLSLGTVIVLVSSSIEFVNTPRLYSDRATR